MRSLASGLFVLLALVACTSAWTDTSYRAGVVEYTPLVASRGRIATREEALQIMSHNVGAYEKYMIEAKASSVDILVFPEYGLNGPNFASREAVYPYLESIPNAGANPCTEHDLYPHLNITYSLSCLARQHQMTIAVDMGDVQPCTRWDHDCPADRRFQFNTLVVFGSEGQILAKYHKTNLYFEPEFDVPINQHPVAFDLFGVRFGMMICFDIMFAKPQVEMLKRYGVTDVIFSSWWVNTPPVLTATQIQQAWSRSFGLNMLASNSGYNERVSGSGIFSRGVALASFTNPTMTSQSRMLIADVPKIQPRKEDPDTPQLPNAKRIAMEGVALDKPLILDTKVLRTWDSSGTMLTDMVEVHGIRCTFSYQIAKSSSGPLSASHSASAAQDATQAAKTNQSLILYATTGYLTPLFPSFTCGVATCPTSDANRCITLNQRLGQSLVANETTFSFFSVKAELEGVFSQLTVFPTSAQDAGVLFADEDLTYSKSSDGKFHTLTTPQRIHNESKSVTLLNVGFLVRNLEVS
jgi:predicted amidohydrolase